MESLNVPGFWSLTAGLPEVILADPQFHQDSNNFKRYIADVERGANFSSSNSPVNHHFSICVLPLEGAFTLGALYTEHHKANTEEVFEEKMGITLFTEVKNNVPSLIFARQNHLSKYEHGLCEEVRKYGLAGGKLFSTFELTIEGEELFPDRKLYTRSIGAFFQSNYYSLMRRVKKFANWSIEYVFYRDQVYITVGKLIRINEKYPEKDHYYYSRKYELPISRVVDHSFVEIDELFNPFSGLDTTRDRRDIGATSSKQVELSKALSLHPAFFTK